MINKDALRQKYKAMRKALPQDVKIDMDNKILNNLLTQLHGVKSVGIYYSFADEIDTHPIIDRLLSMEIEVYLPKTQGTDMTFHRYTHETILKKNSYGISEPDTENGETSKIEVMVVPMLAYNNQGYRLGYGGGFYDRILKDYLGLILGLAYDFSLSEEIDMEKHDIPCHRIITDREVKVYDEI